MKNKVIITTQLYENYNVSEDGFNTCGNKKPYWKPKGGHQFFIMLDEGTLMYTDVKKVLSKMVESHNSIAERFEYISHEIQWSEPTLLGTGEDYDRLNITEVEEEIKD